MQQQKKIPRRILAARLIQPGEAILAGFSGGSDSAALCHALAGLRTELGFFLELFYVQHGLRGAESEAEEEFVRQWAKRYGCPLSVQRVNVRELADAKKLSIETAARHLRYQVFEERARAGGFDKVALAHHAKDQAETVLLHFLRGSGVDGLSGMKPQNGIYIRPLLAAAKAEIEDYLRSEQVAWRQDSSNEDCRYRRNRIRWELLPYLQEAFNPNLVRTLTQTAGQMRDLQEYLKEQIEAEFALTGGYKDGQVTLAGKRLKQLPRYMQQMLIRRAVQAAKGDTVNLEAAHVERALSLLDKENGKREDLIEHWRVKKERGDLVFYQRQVAEQKYPFA